MPTRPGAAPGTEIRPEVVPRPGGVVVTKRRGTAFSGSDLDVVLRARGIDSLVLTGIASSAVVLPSASPPSPTPAWTPTRRCTGSSSGEFRQWADVLAVDDWLKTL